MTDPVPCDILIVEDNPDDAELTLHSLRRGKLLNPVTILEDGAAAIDFLLGRDGGPAAVTPHPRVVFLDLKLPKVSGLEVLAALRADARTASLPIVVITSSREEPDIEAAYRLGANSYVVKPVVFEAFVEAMSAVGVYWLALNTPPG